MNAMRTVMAVVGCIAVLLIISPGEGGGGASQAGQVGWASWYGKPHQGRKTASGERFSPSQLTAAHRSLPLGTQVKVTNLQTGQHVVVKINDRGPYGSGKRRIIDLSEAAAKRVGLLARGTARVQVWWSRTRLKCPTSILLPSHRLTFASDWPWVIGSGGRTALTPRVAVSPPFFRAIIQVLGGETGHLAKVSVSGYLYDHNLRSWNSIGRGRSSQSH